MLTKYSVLQPNMCFETHILLIIVCYVNGSKIRKIAKLVALVLLPQGVGKGLLFVLPKRKEFKRETKSVA